MLHFYPSCAPNSRHAAPRTLIVSLVSLVAALLLPGMATAQNPYAVIDGNVMTLYYGTDMDSHEGAINVTEKFNGAEEWPEAVYQANLQKVIFDASFAQYSPTSLYNLFGSYLQEDIYIPGFGDMKEIVGIENLNTKNVTDMAGMFFDCSSLQNLDLSSFNTQNVTGMAGMFAGCGNLQSLDLSAFYTQNVTDMSGMFWGCYSLQSLTLSTFNTQNVTSMNSMFWGCDSLQSLDLSSFDTRNVTDMRYMFWSCSNLQSLDLSSFYTQNMTEMDYIFEYCTNLAFVTLGPDFKKLGESAFRECPALATINAMAISPEATHENTFDADAYGRVKLKVPQQALEAYLNTPSWNRFIMINDVVKPRPYAVFQDRVMTLYYGTDMDSHEGAFDVTGKFYGAGKWPEQVDMASVQKVVFDASFADYRPTSLAHLFGGNKEIGYFDNLQTIEGLAHLNTSEVTTMAGMFFGCRQLRNIDVTGFNTAKVTDMEKMFAACLSLTSLDLSNFNTANVKSMVDMFSDCASLEILDLSSFSTASTDKTHALAFSCDKLETITFGPEFKKLGKQALSYCKSLATINAMAKLPNSTWSCTFFATDVSRVQLNVPVGSIDIYRNTRWWNEIKNIREVEYSTTGIDTISDDGKPAVIYNLRGHRVEQMDKGVYIVNGKKVVKM